MNNELFNKILSTLYRDEDEAIHLIEGERILIETKNSIGESPLHYLAIENELTKVELLINLGANVNTANEFGNTPLSEAASIGLYDMCEFLLLKGANPQVKNSEGDTALCEAAMNSHSDIVQLLLSSTKIGETINDYFSSLTYNYLFDKDSECAKYIEIKGLKWVKT